MGLFYNYNKEGPGVSKNGPQKRTYLVFLETLFKNFWKLIPVSFFYCLLFVVPGLSAIGITNVTRSLSRNKHTFGTSDFFTAIKKNWKQSLLIGIINVFISVLQIFNLDFFFLIYTNGSMAGVIGLGLSAFMIVMFMIMKFYIWFMVLTFEMKTSQIYLNSLKFFVINLPKNVLMFILIVAYWAILGIVYFNFPHPLTAGIMAVLTIFFYPTYHYLLVQFGVFPAVKKYMIDPYYEEHPEADIDQRRNLGLDVGDDDEADFEDII